MVRAPVQYQKAREYDNRCEKDDICVDCHDLTWADLSKYLGATLSADDSLAHEVEVRANHACLNLLSMTGVCATKGFQSVSSCGCTERLFNLSLYCRVLFGMQGGGKPSVRYGEECVVNVCWNHALRPHP